MQSAATEERSYSFQHQANNSSYSTDSNTQRIGPIGPEGSISRPPGAPHINTNVVKSTSNFSKSVSTSPETRRRPVDSHNRSNSIESVRDGVGNLNRWSESTTSSKGSTAHTRSNSFSRRMSLGSASSFKPGSSKPDNSGIHYPSKRSNSESSTVEGSPQRISSRRPGGPSNPSAALPPIITLPTYHHINDRDQASPQTSTLSPSTSGLLSAAVHSAAPDYFGKSLEDPSSRGIGRRTSMSRSPINPSPLSTVPPRSIKTSNSPVHQQQQERERSRSRGHSRNRSHTTKGSSGTVSSDRSKDRASRQPSQKAMLSNALQKANTAVVLDNAQNFEGAMQAYSEACDLLQQVMLRSSGDDDRRKLEAIRNTYTSRISELERITPYNEDDKALPARPESGEYRDEFSPMGATDDDGTAVIGMAVVTRIVNHDSYVPNSYAPERRPSHIQPSQVPRRRESLMPSPFDTGFQNKPSGHLGDQYIQRSAAPRSPMNQGFLEAQVNLSPPMERQSMMVPPLSPRRPISPADTMHTMDDDQSRKESSQSNDPKLASSKESSHRREISNESVSWLDTIDESGGSAASSVHSRTSSLGVRRKHIRAVSGATEAEFDAALDAAVEAAYDDGFEPSEVRLATTDSDEYEDELANMRIRVEMARERVRQTEMETAVHLARERERARLARDIEEFEQAGEDKYYDDESEEEERMLEEMTRGYVMDEFEFGLQSNSALPRESDSSGFSGRTWHSSLGSNPTTGGTSMTTITEASPVPKLPVFQSKTPPPMHPPPGQALPLPPTPVNAPQFSRPLQTHSPDIPDGTHTVRNRRLSGQNPKQLKIETTPKVAPQTTQTASQPPTMSPPKIPAEPATGHPSMRDEVLPPPLLPQVTGSITNRSRQTSSPFPSTEIASPPTPTLTQNFNVEDNGNSVPQSGSPGRAQSRSGPRKNFSSSSLKNLKSRNLSVSHIDDGSDISPNTPLKGQFGSVSVGNKLPAMPALPTPIAAAFRDKMNGIPTGIPTGGLYLFDSDLHSPESPGSSNHSNLGAPVPLEPCPTEYLLRPFWLMRAIYQTLVHTRGGYLSTKLFVPRDVWRVKGVKIKALEEKVACCDFLTAALQKLAQADTFDADAVLVEMQALEDVLEQVRGTLARKLGNEVGVQGSGMLFKDAPAAADADTGLAGSKISSMPGKSSSFSWRRLRSKSSGVALNTYGGRTPIPDTPKEALTMSTVPMTTMTNIRFAKRDISQARFTGPNSNYMGALARLFDAAQVLDQIARQVEDPGLRHADKTQVGLEFSTRQASEFFGFYICRFVLTDVGLLLDKFLKRGSEWVLV